MTAIHTCLQPTWDTTPRWVHATNASNFRPGQVFGWQDNASPTRFLSGIVREVKHSGLCVFVDAILPAYPPGAQTTLRRRQEGER